MGEFGVARVATGDNLADVMTKNVSEAEMSKHLGGMGCYFKVVTDGKGAEQEPDLLLGRGPNSGPFGACPPTRSMG